MEDVENSIISETDETDKPATDPAVEARVKQWTKRIKTAREHWHKTAFKRMKTCMQLAKDGADKAWVDNDQYVVPIINRHINQAVSQLYAKNPKSYTQRKQRRMFTVWDGELASLQEAAMLLQQSAATGMPDQNAMAVLQDALAVKQYNIMMNGLADTLTLLHNHYFTDKTAQYKQQFKSLVRRTKVCGVGYVKLGFQRILESDPEVAVHIQNTTTQIETLQRLMEEATREDIDADSAELHELTTMLHDLQSQEMLIVQEGPVYTFPKATSVIIDPNCRHLKTLTGADWIAEEIDMTPERIEEVFKVDVGKDYEPYKNDDTAARREWGNGDKPECEPAKVWLVQDRKTGQEFAICDGFKDFLKPPMPPEVKISRFFTIFPLVFNEIEDEDEIFPPSDVWNARHIQKEYNRSRDSLRAHRIANRPAYVAPRGAFEEDDLHKLQDHEDSEIILVNQLSPGEKIEDKIQRKPVVPLDPALYEVEQNYNDLQRTVGSQQANLGGTSGDTATESSIAEQSRTVALSDNIDDIDDLLSLLAHSTGELMLNELDISTVQRIVGPGAVWPQDPETRAEVVEDISLDIRAGSTGRPNQAAEVAKLERAMPVVIQLPNVNPVPITQKYLDLLEVDAEDAIVEGLPSIVAMNAMMKPAGAPPSPTNKDPNAQGGHGGDNGEKPQQNEPQSQPSYPSSDQAQPAA